ncbi:MAG: hypothetical protein ACI4IX_00930 [Acutalibacteraceae bacterium]
MTILDSLFEEIGSYILIAFVGLAVIFLIVKLHKSYKAGRIINFKNKSENNSIDEIKLDEVSMQLDTDEACYYEKKQSLIDNDYRTIKIFGSYATEEKSLKFLWENGSKEDWERALNHYYEILKEEQIAIEKYIENLNADEIKALSVTDFYDFLYDKYFVWKYTQKNRLATTRKALKKYADEDNLSLLAEIQNQIFTMNHNDIEQCLDLATKIHGLGVAGASGLLAVLFPQKFGTIDQFVAKRLKELYISKYCNELNKMNPNSLKKSDGVILIEIMREKADELNHKFNTDFWTPRKIDMILWSIER